MSTAQEIHKCPKCLDLLSEAIDIMYEAEYSGETHMLKCSVRGCTAMVRIVVPQDSLQIAMYEQLIFVDGIIPEDDYFWLTGSCRQQDYSKQI